MIERIKELIQPKVKVYDINWEEIDFKGHPTEAIVFQVPNHVNHNEFAEKIHEQAIASGYELPEDKLKSILVVNAEVEELKKEDLEEMLNQLKES